MIGVEVLNKNAGYFKSIIHRILGMGFASYTEYLA